MKICVISNTNYSAKSVLAVSLAICGKSQALIDGEIERNPIFNNQIIEDFRVEKFETSAPIIFNENAFNSDCDEVCEFGALVREKKSGKLRIIREKCCRCGVCVEVCKRSITEKNMTAGSILRGKIAETEFFAAKVDTGNFLGVQSLTQILMLNKRARNDIIINAAFGLNELTAEAIRFSDYCLLVARDGENSINKIKKLCNYLESEERPFHIVDIDSESDEIARFAKSEFYQYQKISKFFESFNVINFRKRYKLIGCEKIIERIFEKIVKEI